MGFRLREINGESKFCQELSMDASSQVVSNDEVKQVLSSEGIVAQRERKLNMVVTVFIVIGMGLFESLAIGKVYKRWTKGLRHIWPEPELSWSRTVPSATGERKMSKFLKKCIGQNDGGS